MKTFHGFEVFGEEGEQDLDNLLKCVDALLDTKEAKLDLVEGFQAVSKADSSSFWD